MSETPDKQPKIHIDSDWKNQAQAEKQKLAEIEAETKATAGKSAHGPHEIPPASWETLLGVLASQALMYLGGTVDPRTNRVMVDLEAGRHHIDLLSILEERTKGNLSEDETRQLSTLIYEMRMQYMHISQVAAQAGANPDLTGISAPNAGNTPGAPGTIISS